MKPYINLALGLLYMVAFHAPITTVGGVHG